MGASTHMLTLTAAGPNIQTSKQTTTIEFANNSKTSSNKDTNIQQELPPAATIALIVPTFQKSLASIGQLFNSGYKALFDQQSVKIFNKLEMVWEGIRNPITKIWELPLQTEKANNTQVHTEKMTTTETLHKHITFLYQTLGSPTKNG